MPDIFKALADPTRRQILLLVSEKPRTVNELAEGFQMSRPAVSKHIRLLRQAGCLSISRGQDDRRARECQIVPAALQEFNDYLRQLERFWNVKLDNLGNFLDVEED